MGPSRKRSELESRYADLLEHLPVGVYRTRPDGAVVECNRALATMLGFGEAAELQKQNVKDLFPRREDRDEHIRSILDHGEAPAEFRLRRRDGSVIWVRDYMRAVREESGSVLWFDGIIVDITEEHQVREIGRASCRERV